MKLGTGTCSFCGRGTDEVRIDVPSGLTWLFWRMGDGRIVCWVCREDVLGKKNYVTIDWWVSQLFVEEDPLDG